MLPRLRRWPTTMQLKGVQVSVLASPTLSSQPLQWESGVTIQATDISATYAHSLMWGFAKLPVLASPDKGMRSRGHSSWAEAPGLSPVTGRRERERLWRNPREERCHRATCNDCHGDKHIVRAPKQPLRGNVSHFHWWGRRGREAGE